jgi:hypothetical protein
MPQPPARASLAAAGDQAGVRSQPGRCAAHRRRRELHGQRQRQPGAGGWRAAAGAQRWAAAGPAWAALAACCGLACCAWPQRTPLSWHACMPCGVTCRLPAAESMPSSYLVQPSDLSTGRQVKYTDGVPGDLTTAHPKVLPDGTLINFSRCALCAAPRRAAPRRWAPQVPGRGPGRAARPACQLPGPPYYCTTAQLPPHHCPQVPALWRLPRVPAGPGHPGAHPARVHPRPRPAGARLGARLCAQRALRRHLRDAAVLQHAVAGAGHAHG